VYRKTIQIDASLDVFQDDVKLFLSWQIRTLDQLQVL